MTTFLIKVIFFKNKKAELLKYFNQLRSKLFGSSAFLPQKETVALCVLSYP
jgi:hypothetical protein